MSDKVGIFVSHKLEDKEAATHIKKILSEISANKAEVFISEHFPPGENWFDHINKSLLKAKILILLYTAATKDWDWCLFEAGWFTPLEGDDSRKLVCFHNPKEKPPGPLRTLSPVPLRDADVANFLQVLLADATYTQTSEPLNKALAENPVRLNEIARDIVSRFNPNLREDWKPLNKHINLRIDTTQQLGGGIIPANAVVESDQQSLGLFGLEQREWCWADLEEAARRCAKERRVNAIWIEQLARAIEHAGAWRKVQQIQGRFWAADGNVYRLAVDSARIELGGPKEFHVIFVEEPKGEFVPAERRTAALFGQTLRFALKARRDVIEKSIELLDDDPPRGVAADIWKAYEEFEEIAKQNNLDLYNPAATERLFESDPAQINEWTSVHVRWWQLRQELRDAVESEDSLELRACLDELKALNARYVVMLSTCYHKWIVKNIGPDVPSGGGSGKSRSNLSSTALGRRRGARSA